MPRYKGLDLGLRQGLDPLGLAQYGGRQSMATKQPRLERFKNDIARLVLNACDFVQNDVPFLVEFSRRKRAPKRDVREQLERTLGVLGALRRRDPRVFFGRVSVDFAPHRFHAVEDVKRLPLLRPFEQHMFNEMGQTRFICPFVTGPGVDHQRTVCHRTGHPGMNDPKTVGENVGLEFRVHGAKVVRNPVSGPSGQKGQHDRPCHHHHKQGVREDVTCRQPRDAQERQRPKRLQHVGQLIPKRHGHDAAFEGHA